MSASGRIGLVLGLGLGTGCTAPKPPTGPSVMVQADVKRAEDAELARKHDDARKEYERAIADAHDPPSEDFARREYADTLGSWGETAGAIVQLEHAVAAVPGDVAAWNDLGVLYHVQGDDHRALSSLERAKTLAPRDWRPRRQLAALLLALKDYDRATAEYKAMLDLDLPDRLRAAVHKALDLLAALPRTT